MLALDPEPGACIALRIQINDQHPFTNCRQSAVARLMAVVVFPTPPF
jgi:hypothetical protein